MHRRKGAYRAAAEIADTAVSVFCHTEDEPDLIALAGSLKGGILFRRQILPDTVCGIAVCSSSADRSITEPTGASNS